MTSVSTLMAAIPASLGLGPRSEVRAPMAVADTPGPELVHVVRVDLSQAGPEEAAQDEALLSSHERTRALAFARSADRLRFTMARATLCGVLFRVLGTKHCATRAIRAGAPHSDAIYEELLELMYRYAR